MLPGARLPVDGEVLAGQSHADEAMLTGEAAPVPKRPGAAVIGGTINLGGTLVVRAAAPRARARPAFLRRAARAAPGARLRLGPAASLAAASQDLESARDAPCDADAFAHPPVAQGRRPSLRRGAESARARRRCARRAWARTPRWRRSWRWWRWRR